MGNIYRLERDELNQVELCPRNTMMSCKFICIYDSYNLPWLRDRNRIESTYGLLLLVVDKTIELDMFELSNSLTLFYN